MRAILCALLVAGVAAGAARADGLPVLGIDVGAQGVTQPGARYRYVTAAVATRLSRVSTAAAAASDGHESCADHSRSLQSPTTGRRLVFPQTARASR